MAVVPERRCEACSGRLPAQAGPGRRRRYCGTTCRSAARRNRQPGLPTPLMCGLNVGGVHCVRPAEGEILTGQPPAPVYRTCGQCRFVAEALLQPLPRTGVLAWRPLPAAAPPAAGLDLAGVGW
jgi:hypothetical protein